jgi:hypothetical protein
VKAYEVVVNAISPFGFKKVARSLEKEEVSLCSRKSMRRMPEFSGQMSKNWTFCS